MGGQTCQRAPVNSECALETGPLGGYWSLLLEKRSQCYILTTGAERGAKAKISTKTALFLWSFRGEAGTVVATYSSFMVPWQFCLFANIKQTISEWNLLHRRPATKVASELSTTSRPMKNMNDNVCQRTLAAFQVAWTETYRQQLTQANLTPTLILILSLHKGKERYFTSN